MSPRRRVSISTRLLRLAQSLSVALLVVCALLAIGVVGLWVSERHGVTEAGGLLAIPIAAGLIVVARIVRRHRNNGRAVLYCRRFGDYLTLKDRNEWFERTLVTSCRGLQMPVTLQDQSIPSPYAIRTPVSALSGVVVLVCMIGSAVTMLFLVKPWEREIPSFLFFLPFALILLSFSTSNSRLERWLLASIGTRFVDSGFLFLRKQLRRRFSRDGIVVFRSTDRGWQEDIDALLDEVEVAIVDITVATEQLRWECERTIDRLGKENVLFAKAVTSDDRVRCQHHDVAYVEQSVALLCYPREQVDRNDLCVEAARYAACNALRQWLINRQTSSIRDTQRDRDEYCLRATQVKRIASIGYAILTFGALVLSLNIFLGQLAQSVALLAAALGGGMVFMIARSVMAPAALNNSLVVSVGRGIKIVAIFYFSLAAILMVFMVAVELISGGEFLYIAVIALLLIFPAVPKVIITGAVFGIVVETYLLRPPNLKH